MGCNKKMGFETLSSKQSNVSHLYLKCMACINLSGMLHKRKSCTDKSNICCKAIERNSKKGNALLEYSDKAERETMARLFFLLVSVKLLSEN